MLELDTFTAECTSAILIALATSCHQVVVIKVLLISNITPWSVFNLLKSCKDIGELDLTGQSDHKNKRFIIKWTKGMSLDIRAGAMRTFDYEDLPPLMFSRGESLTSLTLSHCVLTDDSLAAIVCSNPLLRRVSLLRCGTQFTEDGFSAFCQQLKCLNHILLLRESPFFDNDRLAERLSSLKGLGFAIMKCSDE